MSGTIPEEPAAKSLPSPTAMTARPMAAAELMRRNSRRGIPAETALAFIRLSIWISLENMRPKFDCAGTLGLDREILARLPGQCVMRVTGIPGRPPRDLAQASARRRSPPRVLH